MVRLNGALKNALMFLLAAALIDVVLGRSPAFFCGDCWGAESLTDSIEVIENLLGESGGGVSEEQIELLSQETRAAHVLAGETGRRRRWWFAELENVFGYRQVWRARAGLRGRLAVGFRSSNDRSNGYVELSRAGPLKKLTVGGLRPRLGEGLLLGARYSPFTPPRVSRQTAGLAASPTASVWGRQRGAVAVCRLWSFDAAAAGWRDDGAGAEACWGSVAYRFRSARAGIAVGSDSRRDYPRAVNMAVFGEVDTPAAVLSGELARSGGRIFAAARTTVRADGDWNFEIYTGPVPRGFSDAVIGPSDLGRRQWGGALHRIERYGGISTRVSVYSSGQRSESERKTRRRLEASGRAGSWRISARINEEQTESLSKRPIEYGQSVDRTRQGTVRADWAGREPGLQTSYSIQMLTGSGGGRDALRLVGGVGLGFVSKWFEIRLKASNYHLAAAQTGYVDRPGLAGYETVSVVTGSGSDLSSRIRVVWPGRGTLGLYWGKPWGGPHRWYAVVKLFT